MIFPSFTRSGSRKAVLYAFPRFGVTLFMGLVDFGLFFLYNEVYLLPAYLVGIGAMLGKIAIALGQFLIGWISDHTQTRWGRRKPYLFFMTPILAITFILLLLPGLFFGNYPSNLSLFLWFASFNIVAQFSYSLITVYHTWTTEQFAVQERPYVSSLQNMFNYLGTGIIVLFTMIVLPDVKEQLQENPSDIPFKFIFTIVLFAGILLSSMYWTAFRMPIESNQASTQTWITELRRIIANKNFLKVCLLQGIASIAWTISQSSLLLYTNIVLKTNSLEQTILGILVIISLILGVFFWRKQIDLNGKKKTLEKLLRYAICILPFTILGIFSFSTSIFFSIPIVIGISLALGGWYLFPYIIYSDIAEDDARKTNNLQPGLYMGFSAILLNIFQAIALFLNGWLHSIPINVSNLESSSTFSIGYILWGPIGAFVLTLALIYTKKSIQLDFYWESQKI